MMDEDAGGFLQGIMRKKVSSDMAMTTLTPLIVRTIGTFQPPLAAMTTPNVPCPTGICHYTHCGCNVTGCYNKLVDISSHVPFYHPCYTWFWSMFYNVTLTFMLMFMNCAMSIYNTKQCAVA